MPSNLPPQLRKLKGYQSQTEAGLIKALQKAQKHVRAEIARIAAQKDVATSAKTREELYAEVEASFKTLSDGIDAQLFELTGKVAAAAHGQAVADVADSGKDSILKYDPKRNQKYFDLVRSGNGKNLAAVFTDQMSADAIRQLRTAFVDVFRQGTVEGMTANGMQKAMQERWDKLAGDDNAFRFRDRSGRAWDNARYLQMLVQTNAQRVAVESYIDTLAESGFSLAQISEDGDPDCHVCAAWEGRIVQTAGKSKKFPTYEEAKAAGVFHPNCTHRLEYVDEDLDADEIKRQGKIGKPPANADAIAVQAQKDLIDEGRYADQGMTADEARRAVTADRTERAILNGTFSEDAATAARMMKGTDLDLLRNGGIPSFALVKQGEKVGWKKGAFGGVVRVPREATAQDVLSAMGFDSDAEAPPPDAPAPVPKPTPAPKAPPESKKPVDPFPASVEGLAVERSLGGSTGAKLVKDAEGRLFVYKRGSSADHVRSEFAADQAYRAAGIDVPEGRIFETPDGPVKLTKYVEGKSLRSYMATATPEERKKLVAELEKGYHVDAILGNWDVIGSAQDNVLVDKTGRPWRIDNGGALAFRAMGERKTDAEWDRFPTDLFTIRQKQPDHFGTVTWKAASERTKATDWTPVIAALPDDQREMVKNRVAEALRYGDRSRRFREDKFDDDHADAVAEHGMYQARAGIRDLLPSNISHENYGKCRSETTKVTTMSSPTQPDYGEIIKQAASSVNFHAKDKTAPSAAKVKAALDLLPKLKAMKGDKAAKYYADYLGKLKKAVDDGTTVEFVDASHKVAKKAAPAPAQPLPVSSYTSATHFIHEYLKANGGDPSYVTGWQQDQSWDSWNDKAIAWKSLVASARTAAPKDTFWKDTSQAGAVAKLKEQHWDRDTAVKTFRMYHAAVQELLETADFENRDDASKTIRVYRTENPTAVGKLYKLKDGEYRQDSIPRGASESTSIFMPKTIHGSFKYTTVQHVPYSRVLGVYFLERNPGAPLQGCFLGANENEFVCDLRGIPLVNIDISGHEHDIPWINKRLSGLLPPPAAL